MPLNDNAKNAMLNHLAGLAVFVSVHSADPGTTGANELAGVARQAVTWNAAATGNLDNNANPSFSVGAGQSVTHGGLWSAASGGTFYGGFDVPDETFTNAGTYTMTDIDVTLP